MGAACACQAAMGPPWTRAGSPLTRQGGVTDLLKGAPSNAQGTDCQGTPVRAAIRGVYPNVDPVLRQAISQLPVAEWV